MCGTPVRQWCKASVHIGARSAGTYWSAKRRYILGREALGYIGAKRPDVAQAPGAGKTLIFKDFGLWDVLKILLKGALRAGASRRLQGRSCGYEPVCALVCATIAVWQEGQHCEPLFLQSKPKRQGAAG